jgi:hypothetical protein
LITYLIASLLATAQPAVGSAVAAEPEFTEAQALVFDLCPGLIGGVSDPKSSSTWSTYGLQPAPDALALKLTRPGKAKPYVYIKGTKGRNVTLMFEDGSTTCASIFGGTLKDEAYRDLKDAMNTESAFSVDQTFPKQQGGPPAEAYLWKIQEGANLRVVLIKTPENDPDPTTIVTIALTKD